MYQKHELFHLLILEAALPDIYMWHVAVDFPTLYPVKVGYC